MKTLVYAFVSSRIEYCNSILAGVSGQLLQRLQSVQNAAERLVTGARRSDRMTPILRQLHWLPIRHFGSLKLSDFFFRLTPGGQTPPTDFDAKWLNRRGFTQGCAFAVKIATFHTP